MWEEAEEVPDHTVIGAACPAELRASVQASPQVALRDHHRPGRLVPGTGISPRGHTLFRVMSLWTPPGMLWPHGPLCLEWHGRSRRHCKAGRAVLIGLSAPQRMQQLKEPEHHLYLGMVDDIDGRQPRHGWPCGHGWDAMRVAAWVLRGFARVTGGGLVRGLTLRCT